MRVCIAVVLALIAVAAANPIRTGARPVVRTPFGRVFGVSTPFVNSYLGIRFAESTAGNNRWAPPVPTFDPAAPPTPNVQIQATSYPNSCPQLDNYPTNPVHISEDCLFLNVFVPRSAPRNKLLPVLVWIYGGGFYEGGTEQYPMEKIFEITNDVIIVSMNYRVGPFSFLLTESLRQSNPGAINFGLLDQQLALKWVQAYIGHFGGDASKVTLWGESAGGASVFFHLLMENSWPYFNNAIMNSPGGSWPLQTVQQALAQGATFEGIVGCDTAADKLACVRSKDIETMLQGMVLFPSFPIIDGVQIKDHPFKLLSNGQYKTDAAVLLGENFAEGEIFAWFYAFFSGYSGEEQYRQITQDDWIGYMSHEIGLLDPSLAPALTAPYQSIADSEGPWYAFANNIGDYIIHCGTDYTARALANFTTAPVYRYFFTHRTENYDFAFLNSTHYTETPYILGRDDYYASAFTPQEQRLRRQLTKQWIKFAATGNPNAPSLPNWPVWSGDYNTQIRTIDLEPSIGWSESKWSRCPNYVQTLCPSCPGH